MHGKMTSELSVTSSLALHTLEITESGKLYGWGWNLYGQVVSLFIPTQLDINERNVGCHLCCVCLIYFETNELSLHV